MIRYGPLDEIHHAEPVVHDNHAVRARSLVHEDGAERVSVAVAAAHRAQVVVGEDVPVDDDHPLADPGVDGGEADGAGGIAGLGLDRVVELDPTSEAGNPPPLTMTDAEWRASADIFPMEYADILDGHRVLHGTPPFDGVKPSREHLRLQTEHEAMGKLIQFRQGILRTGGDHRRIVELVRDSLSTFMVIFRSVVRLHGETPPRDYEELSTKVGRLAGFDAAPFIRVVRHVRGAQLLTEQETTGVLSGYLENVHRLVEHIDRMGHA